MKSREKEHNELLSAIKREKKKNYFILYTVVLVVWLALLAVSFIFNFFSGQEFIVNVVNNLIGILPPILIFDFFNEKLSSDANAVEMSTKITETLISNPETMDLFTEEQKKGFIKSAVASMVKDEDAVEMITDTMGSYLDHNINCRIKTAFDYNFELSGTLPVSFDEVLCKKDSYYYLQERLFYKVKFLSDKVNNMTTDIVKIGFLYENTALDSTLRERPDGNVFDNCIFRESLDIKAEDMEKFRSAVNSPEAFRRIFKLDLQVDSFKCELIGVDFYNEGIICRFKSTHDTRATEHTVRIIFHMPRSYDSVIEVALVDPVKAPKISVSYPEDLMDVDMFTFLSKGEESSLEVAHEHMNGIYDISLTNEWIQPISGMVFKINRLHA